jgi:hypothetical protein
MATWGFNLDTPM